MNHPLLALVSTILDHNQSNNIRKLDLYQTSTILDHNQSNNIRKLDLYQTQLKDMEHYSPAVSPHDQSI